MPNRAPRHPWRLCRAAARGALLTLALLRGGAAVAEIETCPAGIELLQAPLTRAEYQHPTNRYPHGVLGDDTEYAALDLTYADLSRTVRFELPDWRVFEDVAPRVIDLDGDGRAREVMVVESHQEKGARLAVYNSCGLIAATPFIGTRFRWLAPLGAADLDGDGHVELAYVDRPHLAKILRVWRYQDGGLIEVAQLANVSNHQIGWPYIIGGLRRCAGTWDMVLATGDWSDLVAVRFLGDLQVTRLGRFDPARLSAAMECR